MERRMFLGGLTAASFGVPLENAFADPVRPTGKIMDFCSCAKAPASIPLSGGVLETRGGSERILLCRR